MELLKQPTAPAQDQIVPLTIKNSQREMETV
jgi:hypothetical protein